MNRAIGRADEHGVLVVFVFGPTDVTVFLDHTIDLLTLGNDVVEEKLRGLSQTEHAHAIVARHVAWNVKLHPDKGLLAVQHGALALGVHDALVLKLGATGAHVHFLVHAGHEGDRGRLAVMFDIGEALEEGNVVNKAVNIEDLVFFGLITRRVVVLGDDFLDAGYVEVVGMLDFGLFDSTSTNSGCVGLALVG